MKKLFTLCLIHQDQKILLGLKKRGFGAGYWNGFGGKIKEGESLEDATEREVEEEISVQVDNFEKVGILDFEFQGDSQILQVHIFKTANFSGAPEESEEMRPQWFDVSEIPFEKMWPDDKYWLPLLLAGKKFRGKFLFGEGHKILGQELGEVDKI